MADDYLEQIQEDLEKESEQKQKQPMPQSGRSVFELERIIKEQSKKNKPKSD